MNPHADKVRLDPNRFPLLGMFACALAGTDLFATLAALALHAADGRFHDLATSFGWLVFDYGFALDLLAVLLAILGIVSGGQNRRRGLVALALVAFSFALLFV